MFKKPSFYVIVVIVLALIGGTIWWFTPGTTDTEAITPKEVDVETGDTPTPAEGDPEPDTEGLTARVGALEKTSEKILAKLGEIDKFIKKSSESDGPSPPVQVINQCHCDRSCGESCDRCCGSRLEKILIQVCSPGGIGSDHGILQVQDRCVVTYNCGGEDRLRVLLKIVTRCGVKEEWRYVKAYCRNPAGDRARVKLYTSKNRTSGKMHYIYTTNG
jgi:hypothetical protein